MTRPTLHGFYAPPAWVERALCAEVSPDIFFPERDGTPGTTSDARKVCAMCDVRQECLEYALENDQRYGVEGIWGGMTPNQRRQLARRREIA